MRKNSSYSVVARRFIRKNSRFSTPRPVPGSVRRFGAWDEFRKDKNFRELGEEMSKLRDRAEKRAQSLKDSETWEKSTEFAESTISSTKSRLGKLGQALRERKNMSVKQCNLKQKALTD
eukprot:TRINITY_DN2847_c0_g1_i1.p1 TRINITY_DN2847_c0_g1~~TRINITY_DN2847_c0_g1_i1.p1  ORF type:complete len:119 (-),score=7.38 TRINITY_DN2847_c0_g1_i1:132-488(-)